MVLSPVQSVSLSDQVFEQLVSAILNGRYKPGSALPAERKLVETFGVNRHVVREALKRLEQLQLVKISQGGSTRVLDFHLSAGLDLLALMADHATVDPQSLAYWLSVSEMRLALGADAVRLCARRASPELKASLLQQAEAMRAAAADEDTLFGLEVRFWQTVFEGAGNLAYRLALNTMLRAISSSSVARLMRPGSIQEVRQSNYRADIAAAIHAGDADAAERATRASLSAGVALLDVAVNGAGKAVVTAAPVVPKASSPARGKPAPATKASKPRPAPAKKRARKKS